MLICVCDRAEAMRCSVCPKYKRDKPDATMNHPSWRYERDQHTRSNHGKAKDKGKKVDETL